MSSAVFDTNVLASGFVGLTRPESTPGALIRHWSAHRFDLVVSGIIIRELERTFEQPFFRRRLSPQQMARHLQSLRADALFTAVTVRVQGVATHPKDDLVLATAVSARADYLVTDDSQILQLGSYAGVRIVSPREFLDVLQAGSGAGGA
jgi:putative PIN family toxin of toxin-antitoxin system